MKKKFALYGLFSLLAGSALVTVAIARHFQGSSHNSMQMADVTTNPHAGHSLDDMNMSAMSQNGHHQEHTMPLNKKGALQAKLSVNQPITSGKSIPLFIDIEDSNSQKITKFDIFQEKLMHLIIVSDDLEFFDHLHPIYKQNGRFQVEANFPTSGGYTIFTDYKPSGQKEEVSVSTIQVPGKSKSPSKIDLNTTKIVADTKVNLILSQPILKVDQEVTLTFDLKQAANKQPITDLQPYLGEKGHLVIIKQSSPLRRNDYIHAHAIKDNSGDKVQFITSFPEPGNYKLWGQFNRNGKIVIADFWVTVIPN